MFRINYIGISVIITFSIIARDLIDMIGSEKNLTAYTYQWYDSIIVAVFIAIIFIFGKYSIIEKDKKNRS